MSVILPQLSGYIKYFDDGRKNISFITDDKEIYEKYNEIWEVIRKLLKLKLTVNPNRDDKYIIAKLKIFKNLNITTFTNNVIPEENTCYTCISEIDIDSVLKIDKKSFPQIIDYDSENDSGSDSIMLKLKVKKKLKILNYLDNHRNHL